MKHVLLLAFQMPFLKVLFEREGTLVVDKPASLSSEQRDPTGESALALVRREFPEARLPHRLDRLSCGILVVATDGEALAVHNEAIAAGRWGPKLYVARLERAVPLGPRKAYLRRRGKRSYVVRAGGKPSSLDVLHCSEGDEAFDVVLRLRTGRYHQIRAMMAHEGAPLLGDELYGSSAPCRPRLCHAAFRLPIDDRVVRSSFVDDLFSLSDAPDFLRDLQDWDDC